MNGNHDFLLENGTLLPDGTISRNKINLLSGAHTPDFAEMISTITNGDQSAINRMTGLFTRLYSEGFGDGFGVDCAAVYHALAEHFLLCFIEQPEVELIRIIQP